MMWARKRDAQHGANERAPKMPPLTNEANRRIADLGSAFHNAKRIWIEAGRPMGDDSAERFNLQAAAEEYHAECDRYGVAPWKE